MIRSLVVTALLAVFLCAAASAQDVTRVVKGGVLNGKAIALPKPAYPEAARVAGVGGIVAVNIVIDESGAVVEAVADPNDQRERYDANGMKMEAVPADPSLREAAEKAALGARFSPTFLNGEPVRVKGMVLYNFVPRGDESAFPTAKSVNGGVLNGRATSMPAPLYPAAAKAVGAQGAVNVKIIIDENGRVMEAAAVSGHPLLRSAAEAAAREATFEPTLLSGQAVKVSGIVTYNFVLP